MPIKSLWQMLRMTSGPLRLAMRDIPMAAPTLRALTLRGLRMKTAT